MKIYTVVCIGYNEPDKKEIIELLERERNWLENFENDNRKICIHPGICIRETETYNQSVLDDLERRHYSEYNLDAHELNTEYNFNARFDFRIKIA